MTDVNGVQNMYLRHNIPTLECLIQRTQDNALAVGYQRDRVHRVAVPLEVFDKQGCTQLLA